MDSFENQKSRALKSIQDIDDVNKSVWFYKLFEILSNQSYATIKFDNRFVDIERFAHTNKFASFFDIYNHMYSIDFSVDPVIAKGLYYSLI